MACSTSECLASATLAWTSPVLGSKTSPKRPDVPLTTLPPMKWPISRMGRVPPLFERLQIARLGHLAPFCRDSRSFSAAGHQLVAVCGPFFFHQRLAFTHLYERRSRVALGVARTRRQVVRVGGCGYGYRKQV